MCNLYTQTKSVDEIARLFRDIEMPLAFPEGAPNLKPGDIAITDPGAIVRRAGDGSTALELVTRRWSWPGPGGKPVYNFRSDGREFSSGRCLIIADGFYEFTANEDPKAKRKRKWRFTLNDAPIFGVAGLWRSTPDVDEAFTMLTMPPGADIAPYHSRQIAVLAPEQFAPWLDPKVRAADVLKVLPAGSLSVEQIA